MRKFFIVCLVVIIAIVLMIDQAIKDPGYILISVGDYLIETSIWFPVMALLATLLLIWILIKLVAILSNPMTNWGRKARLNRKSRKASQGQIELALGNWSNAKKMLTASAKSAEAPLAHYLSAAQAAYQLGSFDEGDALLKQARKEIPEASVAIGIRQAELQLKHQQLTACRETLIQLQPRQPKNARILELLTELCMALKDWNLLELNLPNLAKHGLHSSERQKELEQLTYSRLLSQTLHAHKDELIVALEEIKVIWKRKPKSLNQDASLLLVYLNCLTKLDQPQLAEKACTEFLKKQWDDCIILAYSKLEGGEPARQFKQAQSWYKRHQDNAIFLLAIGRLARRSKQWDKAMEYLKASLAITPSKEVDGELALLSLQLGEHQKANEYFQRLVSATDGHLV
ncbi:MAG: heme biosynthesis HemY N-terminal domain-containing protein [Pseudomonadales bacterium]|nr:heme biosynthesis HemY N-terminal domain-containing protein [Pseudomonadales bacterium]